MQATISSKPVSFKAKVSAGRTNFTIQLPKEVEQHIAVTQGEVYCTLIDGVLQISGQMPNVAIPVLHLDPTDFIPQSRR